MQDRATNLGGLAVPRLDIDENYCRHELPALNECLALAALRLAALRAADNPPKTDSLIRGRRKARHASRAPEALRSLYALHANVAAVTPSCY
jgi:hypothetical protein